MSHYGFQWVKRIITTECYWPNCAYCNSSYVAIGHPFVAKIIAISYFFITFVGVTITTTIWTFMRKIKEFFRRIASYISPAYVTMLVAAFILWYITKLGDTYTTDHMVTVVVDGKAFDVGCTIRGKGTNLISYTMSSKRSSFEVPSAELSFDKEVTDDEGKTYRHVTGHSMQQALASRMNDVDVVAVSKLPTIESYEQ